MTADCMRGTSIVKWRVKFTWTEFTSWGTSCRRSSALMCSSVSIEGDNPPWRQKILRRERLNVNAWRAESLCHALYGAQHRCHTWVRRPHLVIDKCSEGQIVKQICEVLPNIGISIFPQAFVVKAVHLCDLSALVVPSENCDSLTKPYLQHKMRV